MSGDAVLEAVRLVRLLGREGFPAVRDVSLRVLPGRIHALLGPNGAGKSTTVRMCATLLRPTSGSVAVDGVDAVADTAQIAVDLLGAVRDGGRVSILRPVSQDDPGRGITLLPLTVRKRATDQAAMAGLRDLIESRTLSIRLGPVLPASQAAEAHRLLEAGGQRGRIVLTFPVD